MNKSIKFILTLTLTVVIGFSVAYVVNRGIHKRQQQPHAIEVLVLSEPSEETKFYNTALSDPAAIEQQPTAFTSSSGWTQQPAPVSAVGDVSNDEIYQYPAELSAGQIALRNQLSDFSSLRQSSIRNPGSPENRRTLSAIAHLRQKRFGQPERPK